MKLPHRVYVATPHRALGRVGGARTQARGLTTLAAGTAPPYGAEDMRSLERSLIEWVDGLGLLDASRTGGGGGGGGELPAAAAALDDLIDGDSLSEPFVWPGFPHPAL